MPLLNESLTDQSYLEKADTLSQQIRQLQTDLKGQEPLLNQLKLHEEALDSSREYLSEDNHSIAFIGSVGVGKTTAICHLFGLVDSEGEPLLSTSSGRTTLCEVEIRQASEVRILIDPLSKAAVHGHLLDFVALMEQRQGGVTVAESDSSSISSEFERCIRNMLGLTVKRSKTADGKIQKTDAALEHLHQLGRIDAFLDDAVERLRLDDRTATELSPPEGIDPDEWIKETFASINHGRHPDAPLPRRIVIERPVQTLAIEGLEVAIVDTKGLDQTFERQDIDSWLSDPRTISVVCSRFNDAPEQNAQGLMNHMREIGMGHELTYETSLLILDRNDEAAQVMAEDGMVEDFEEGRLIRQEQVEDTLRGTLQMAQTDLPPILFFQATSEEPTGIITTLGSQIQNLRQRRRDRIDEVAKALDELSNNREAARAKAAFETVSDAINAWADTGRQTIARISQIYKPLVDDITMKEVYASSIRAAVNRQGEWPNFDFYYKLANAARRKTVASFSASVAEIQSVLANQEKQDALTPAHPFIRLLQSRIRERVERIHEKAASMAKQAFEPALGKDEPFWKKQRSEWGQGPGYKNRIASSAEQWFRDHSPAPQEQAIQTEVTEAWINLIREVESLLSKRA